MKSRLWKVAKCIVFCAVLLGAVGIAYRVLKWKDTTGEYLSSVEQMYATGENLIDVVFVGSSHCYCGIQPAILWEQYGIAAFDLCVSGQDKDSAYHDLVELYKTQNPSVVYVDLYALLYDEHLVESNVYRNYLSLKTSLNSIDLVNQYIDKADRNSFYFRFPIIHTRYRELKKYDFAVYPPNSFGRGEYFEFHNYGSWINEEALRNQEIGELSPKNREWLNDLIRLAKEHESKIEFMLIPFPISSQEQGLLNAARELVTQQGCSYWDFNRMREELGIDLLSDFSDDLHLNMSGAEKLTGFLGSHISEAYALADHRGEAAYWQWDDDLKWYRNAKRRDQMAKTQDISEYVSSVLQYEGGVTVISLDGDFLDEASGYGAALAALGINYEEFCIGGKWIYKDGSAQKIQENLSGVSDCYLELSRYDTLRLAYYEPFDPSNILIGRNSYQRQEPLSFVTYDLLLEEVVSSRGF